jgi:hypothetical protein
MPVRRTETRRRQFREQLQRPQRAHRLSRKRHPSVEDLFVRNERRATDRRFARQAFRRGHRRRRQPNPHRQARINPHPQIPNRGTDILALLLGSWGVQLPLARASTFFPNFPEQKTLPTPPLILHDRSSHNLISPRQLLRQSLHFLGLDKQRHNHHAIAPQ